MATTARLARHIQLLIALVASELLNPLIAQENLRARILSAAFFSVVCVAVFRALFRTRRRRWIGSILAGIAIALHLARLLVPSALKVPLEEALNVSAAVFFAFVLSAIVNQVFSARQLRSDDVVGAFSGYILIALIWGRLFTLVWMTVPGAFGINPAVRWQLDNWDTLNALFDYYSFTTISSIGYGDITTTRPVSNALVWLEVMCGQFYMAVVVASIVGMKVAQALASPRDAS